MDEIKLAEFRERQLEKRRKAVEKKRKEAKAKRDKIKERERKKEDTRRRALQKKREAYKPIHIKNLRKKQNARAYKKRRKVELAEHKRNGDVYGYYRIVVMRDYEQIQELSSSWWMLTAYKKYNNYIEKNNKNVICEKQIVKSSERYEPVKYEILLLKRIDPDVDDGIRSFRNDIGTFIENKISNNNRYAIIAKSDWFVPETYNVYGYNPVSDRKTGRWIYDNIINVNCSKDNLKIVYMCENKLVVQYNEDIDFVLCKNANECLRLYNGLQGATDKKNKFVIYSSYLVNSRKTWLYDKIQQKTGWDRAMVRKTKL